jgi:hypothetical protein
MASRSAQVSAAYTTSAAAHPLFAEVRAHRLALAKLLQAVSLPADDQPDRHAGAGRSAAGAQLARLRWGQAEGAR